MNMISSVKEFLEKFKSEEQSKIEEKLNSLLKEFHNANEIYTALKEMLPVDSYWNNRGKYLFETANHLELQLLKQAVEETFFYEHKEYYKQRTKDRFFTFLKVLKTKNINEQEKLTRILSSDLGEEKFLSIKNKLTSRYEHFWNEEKMNKTTNNKEDQ